MISANGDDILRIVNTVMNVGGLVALKFIYDIRSEIVKTKSDVMEVINEFKLDVGEKFLTKSDFWRAQDEETRRRIKRNENAENRESGS